MYQGLPLKNLSLVPRNVVGVSFCAVFQKPSGSKKFMGKRRGECEDFPSKNFFLTVPKNFVEETFRVS